MKKKILLPLLMLCVGSLATATATGCKKDPKPTEPTALETLINKESITLELNQEYLLTLDYDGEETPTWTVGDSTIVSVENGKLVALKPGTTTVTVTIGSYTDTISVTVSEMEAENLSLEVVDSNVSLYKNEEKQITAIVKYNGVAIDSISEKSYESTNADIVSVDANGKMTAKAYGNATITITYKVNDTLLLSSVNVSVVSSGKVEITNNATELVYGSESVTLTAKAYEKGVENTSASIVWSATAGQDVIEIDNGTITAKNAGETQVTATYVDSEGKTQTDTITVTVSPKEVDSGKSLTLYKNKIADGYTVDLETLVNDENAMLGGYVVEADGLKAELPFADDKLSFSALSGNGGKGLYLQTRNITYKVDLELWTAKIENAADLKTLQTTTDGWYLLNADIDLTGETWEYEEEAQFGGIFDGNGHSIKGLTTVNSGLFSALSGNALVKDLTLQAKVTTGGALCKNVTKGSSVTIENVTTYADIWGTLSSGLIGQLSGQVTLKNVTGVATQAEASDTNGALFATATVEPTLENVKVYSMLKLCGGSKDDNGKAETLNEKAGIVTTPTVYSQTFTTLDIEKTGEAGLSVELNNNAYVGYTVCANQARTTDSTTNGTVLLMTSDVEWRFGGYVDVLFEKADGTIDAYTIPIDKTYYLGNANFKKYLRVTTAKTLTNNCIIAEDITLDGTDWKSNITFSGTFDGQGHTIKGLTIYKGSTSNYGGLFRSLQNATIKNVALVDTKISGQTAGVFAYNAGSVTFENVYVSIANTTFGEHYAKSPYEHVLTDQSQKAGLINRGNDAVITLKNCVIYMPENLTKASGFISSYGKPTLTIENSTFIGGNGALVGTRSDQTTQITYTEDGDDFVITDAVAAYKALYGNDFDKTQKENANGWTAMQIAAYEANHPLLLLNASNKADLSTATSEIVVLTENVALSNTYLGDSNVFTGVFDGQGYTISGIKTANQKGGLFKELEGSVKNVALKGTASSSSGLLTDRVRVTAYLENVYLEPTFGNGSAASVARWINGDASLSMKNVVINVAAFANDKNGVVAGFMIDKNRTSACGIYMDNCYAVAPEERPIGNKGDAYYVQANTGDVGYFFWNAEYDGETLTKADDGLTWYTTIDALKAGASLTDFQKTWLGISQAN